MEPIICNNELQLSGLEDFRAMTDEERAGLKAIAEGEGICLKAPDLHIIISIGWKKTGGFLSRLLSADDLVKKYGSHLPKGIPPLQLCDG